MKKVIVYLCTIILGASIPIYFLLIWEPLKSEEVLSANAIINDENEEIVSNDTNLENIALKQSDTTNSLFNNLDNDRRDKLNTIMKKLSVVDLIKINDYFSDKNNSDRIKMGAELAKKRMVSTDYEIFKNILENYIDESILD
ncbi:MAG: hypothetical protein E7212_11035 [Clostridium sartagoforme]|nr:hypothetical protein [Clostridium sartagoforme]